MNDNRDQFFNNLFDESARAQTDGFQRQLSYENRVIRRVFNECGVKVPSWGQLVNMCKADTGTHEMSFTWFNSTFPRFPATLCGKRIGYCGYRRDDAGNKTSLSLYQLNIGDLLSGKNNILVRTISKALHVFAIDVSSPFVFTFPIGRKPFVAHNLNLSGCLNDETPRVVWTFENKAALLRVEHSSTFFGLLGADWFN